MVLRKQLAEAQVRIKNARRESRRVKETTNPLENGVNSASGSANATRQPVAISSIASGLGSPEKPWNDPATGGKQKKEKMPRTKAKRQAEQ